MSGRFPRGFGKYVLLKPLAKGGMGEIYVAAGGQIGGFEKLCVIKKVIAEKADRAKANRFLDEAKVVLRLSHSCLVTTFDAGEVEGEFYIAMELVEGKDLREVWNRCVRTRQRIPLDVALHIVREVARALSYVHAYGDLKLVHRDVAPPNILLAYVGDVKLTDFGLARSVLKQEHTAPGVVYGRAAYLAPEQARGEVADARTDVYTLGIVLWELLTGQQFLQIAGLDPATALAVVRHPKLVKPSQRAPWITPELDAVVMKALASEREERFASADEMRRALNEVIANIAPRAGADRIAEFLETIYADTIKEESDERERFLRDDIPAFRRDSDDGAAEPVRPPPPPPRPPRRPAGEDSNTQPRVRVGRATPAPRRKHSARRAPPPDVNRRGSGTGPRLPGLPPSPKPPAQPPPHGPAAGPSARPGLVMAAGATAAASSARGETEGQAFAAEDLWEDEAAETDDRPDYDGQTDVGRAFAKKFVGRVLGARYRVVSTIGEGGMGQVFAAEHVEIGKRVAIKVLHPACSSRPDLVERFRLEARAASKIGHPGIVNVTDFGTTEEGLVYYVMEQLQGVDLAEVLAQERRIDPERAVQITIQVCQALQAAHEAEIIHRDLKPENIFLQPRGAQGDEVKIIDFGLARSLQESAVGANGRPLTNPGTPIGTPEYMAPEQADGKPADARSDLYSVGAILYEMITGQPAFAGQGYADVLVRKSSQRPREPRETVPQITRELNDLIMVTLERDPARRPQTMAQLEYQLTKALRGRGKAVAALLGIEPDHARTPSPVVARPDPQPRTQARRDAALKAIEQLAAASAGPPLDGDDLTVPAATVFPDLDHDASTDTVQDLPAFGVTAAARPPAGPPASVVISADVVMPAPRRPAAPPPAIGSAFLERHGVRPAGKASPVWQRPKVLAAAAGIAALLALLALLLR